MSSDLLDVFPGYRVEKLEQKDELDRAYRVIGPRKTFYLCRNVPNPHMLFVDPFGSSGKIRGYEWFTDKDGQVRPVR